ILIVDDEPDVLRILEKRLAVNGYQVLTADGGFKALEMARKENPALVILDIDMPDMDGGEVAARLKEDDATKHIPVIFLSCLVTHKEEDGAALGDSVFMAKPYNPNKLIDEIERLL
ncbi:MAG: response regulator, partial [Planctomycetes bacterium]|nr:response regulator [Planctomycetota bacterium]